MQKIFSFDGRGGIMNILLVLLIGCGVKSCELLQLISCSVWKSWKKLATLWKKM